MKIGEKIKSIRELKQLSQRRFSEEIGISHAELSRIETGDRKYPCPKTLKTISENYDESYFSLMMLAGYLDNNLIIKQEDTISIENAVINTLEKENLELKQEIQKYENKINRLLEVINE